MDTQTLDPRRLLRYPVVYNTFQKIVGAEAPRKRFIQDFVAPRAGTRMLEIGCGPGTNCEWVPTSVAFVGCDLSSEYIDYATRRYGNRATFFNVPVGSLEDLDLEPFDTVVAIALLHHLSNEEVLTLCREVRHLLKPGGAFKTIDPCFTADQSYVQRFIAAHDRGNHVRYPEQYQELLECVFDRVDIRTEKNKMRLPGHGAMIAAYR